MQEERKKRLMCFFWMHMYELMEQYNITNEDDKITGVAYVSKCKICGKIHTTYVPISEAWVQRVKVLTLS